MGRKSGHLLTEVLFSFMVIMIIVHGLSLMFTKLAEVNLSGNNDLRLTPTVCIAAIPHVTMIIGIIMIAQ